MTGIARPALRQLAGGWNEPLLRSAYSLMANTLITAILGVAFWAVAAQAFPSSTVGQDAALITAMITLSTICQLNLGNAVVRFLPPMRDGAGRALAVGYLVAIVASLAGGFAFLWVLPQVSERFAFLSDSELLLVGFPVGVALWSVFALQDAALVALRRAPWVAGEGMAFGLLKLLALPVFVGLAVHGVFAAWVVGMALLILPINWLIFRRALPAHVPEQPEAGSAVFSSRRRNATFLLQDYLATVLNVGAVTLLPLLVIAVLGSEQNAYFFMPFSIMLVIELLVLGAGTSLVAESSRNEALAADLARRLIRRVGPLLLAGTALLAVAAPLVLLPFGAEYAEEGTPVLRLLAVATLFHAVTILFVSLARVQRRGTRILAAYFCWFLLQAALTYVLAKAMGISGVALGWLLANASIALLVAPSLLRFLRSGRSRGETHPADPDLSVRVRA